MPHRPSHVNLFTPVRRILFRVALSALACSATFAAHKWKRIDPAELADDHARVDPEAGVEILLREVTMDSADFDESEIRYYVRAKVYSARGIEQLSKIEIPFTKGLPVTDIAARTTHPDGSTVELNRKDVFEREVLRADNLRVKVKSFAPPGLVPGSIVEYTYVEKPDYPLFLFPLYFQTDLPAREVRFHVRAMDTLNLGLRALFFNCPSQDIKADRDGFRHFQMSNVAAIAEEPFAPPALGVRPTVLIYYTLPLDFPPDLYWSLRGSQLQDEADKQLPLTRKLKPLVDSLTQAGESPQDSVLRYYDYCRTKIINRETDTTRFTPKQRRKLPVNESPTDTFKHGYGTSYDINLLFAAMAQSTGLLTRLAWVGDRSQLFFTRRIPESFMLPRLVVAVQLGADWSYFDPANRYLPPGRLAWNNTDTYVLLADAALATPQPIEGAPAEFSQRQRTARLQLQSDGSLEGDVTVTYTGLWEMEMKGLLDEQSAEERVATLRKEIQASLPLADVSALTVQNADDPLAPLSLAYHLRVPEYAERTGSRLLLQPAVFQKGAKPLFDQTNRKQEVVLHYRSTAQDDITIQLPPDFELESGSSPPRLNLGETASYQVTLGTLKSSGAIAYRRTLAIKEVRFPAASYASLKRAFDEVLARDNHALTLRRKPAASETPSAAAPVAVDSES